MPEKENGRTHEPSLRETVSQLDDLKELMLVMLDTQSKVADERDRRYEDRFMAQQAAVAAALEAQKEATSATFLSSEKAIVKAEDAQRDYNTRSNEFRGQLDDQAKHLMPRAEALSKFEAIEIRHADMKKSYDDELARLRETHSVLSGERLQQSTDKTQSNWLVGTVITIALAVLSLTVAVIFALIKKP